MHPKWKFLGRPPRHIHYGSENTFPDPESSEERIASFRVLLDAFQEANGIQNSFTEVKMYNTGGHADIDYYALVIANDTGGCECVFYRMWGKKYEATPPFVSLYGSWVEWEDALKAILYAQYGARNR